jgi:hypothetical protein
MRNRTYAVYNTVTGAIRQFVSVPPHMAKIQATEENENVVECGDDIADAMRNAAVDGQVAPYRIDPTTKQAVPTA